VANPSGPVCALAIAMAAALLFGCGDGSRPGVPSPTPPPTASATAAEQPVPTATAQARAYAIAISAGHGGPENAGAVHRNAQGETDLVEKDLTLDVARRLDGLLRAGGYRTVLIRDGDYSLAPTVPGDFAASVRAESQARADIANEAGADIILAIHFNGSDDATQSGTEVYYNPDRSFGEQSRVLATSIYDAIVARLRELGYDTRQRGVKDDGGTAAAALTGEGHTFLLGETPGFRWTEMPGMIGEALFASNDAEAALLQRDDVLQAIAQAYKDGIDAYFSWLSAQD
jgi:N-acetylmuramoyl-L-alanine amidase